MTNKEAKHARGVQNMRTFRIKNTRNLWTELKENIQ